MAADDDVRDAELDDRRTRLWPSHANKAVVLRHDVAGIAQDKQLSGLRLRQKK